MFRVLITVVFLGLFNPAFAEDERDQTQKQIETARQDIAELQKALGNLQAEKSGVQKDLRTTETEMGKLEKQVEVLQNELKKTEVELSRLDQEKKKLADARLEQQRLIAVQARAAYQGGHQEYLKLLLNQQHPEKFARTLTYYDYLSKARLTQLQQFNDTLRQLSAVEKDIDQQQAQLLTQKNTLGSQSQELGKAREERQKALSKINQQYKAGDQKLQARQQDQAELNNVLKTIEETLARQAREAEEARQKALIAAREAEAEAERQRKQREREREREALARNSRQDDEPAPKRPVKAPSVAVSSDGAVYGGAFGEARGKLPWPINGRLLARFGEARGDDERSRWDGVMISAAAGGQVRAVHGGRVVFADWLRGAGLLVILDHGNGYLSLYGHNQSLLKKAGDIVKAGDVISTVGNSGGQETSALYFAIRQQGRPSDPAQWCRSQG